MRVRHLLEPSHDKTVREQPPTHKNANMSAGCCDADSPWLSWSYWFEPLYTRARKRTIEEQEMIEACTTPRSGRTSFDE